MAEFALAMPVLVLLLVGMTLAAFYAFRAAAADWGVFIVGAAGGAFESPATEQVRPSIAWEDIRNSVTAGEQPGDRRVQSRIEILASHPWLLGVNPLETQRGTAYFRLWRFYPGPPLPGGVE